MSAAENVKPIAPKVPNLEPGQTFVIGRIKGAKKLGKTWVHLVMAPAADEYSFPKSYEITSKTRLGDEEELVKLTCELYGKSVQKSYTNKEDGEVVKFKGAYMSLRVVE